MNGAPLSPWDRLSAYRLPVETSFNLNVLTPVLIAPGDPMREALIIGIAGVSNSSTTISYPIPIAFGTVTITSAIPNAVISTNPNVTVNGGLVLNPVLGPLIIDYARWKALVQQPWYAISLGSGPLITVIQLPMQDWPEDPTTPSIIQQVDNGNFLGRVVRPSNGVRRSKLYGNRWGQPQAAPFDYLSLQ